MNGSPRFGPTKLTAPCEHDRTALSCHDQAVPGPKLLPREPDGWFEYIDPPAEFQDMERVKENPGTFIKPSAASSSRTNLEVLKFEAMISNFVSKLVQSTFQEVWGLQRRNVPHKDSKRPSTHTYVNVCDEASTQTPDTLVDQEVSTQPTAVCELFSVTEEVYNVPVDAIDPQQQQQPVRRRKTTTRTKATLEDHSLIAVRVQRREKTTTATADLHNKRHSLAYPAANRSEPIHMTLEEVRGYLKEMHRSPGNVLRRPLLRAGTQPGTSSFLDCRRSLMLPSSSSLDDEGSSKPRKRHSLFFYHLWMKRNRPTNHADATSFANHHHSSFRRLDLNNALSVNLKQVFCNVFKPKRTDNSVMTTSWTFSSPQQQQTSHAVQESIGSCSPGASPACNTHRRALPPVPTGREDEGDMIVTSSQAVNLVEAAENSPVISMRSKSKASSFDFATSIEAVKDYGWYWGPLSGEAAEKILSTEPDGSFIVRDSSDDHYIFSLTFKLSGCIRHVRIEHDHGNFSFGSVTKFKSQTIVEFIEKAVEHSRSGRYLFFLHRRPVLGPMRVQLLHPVSRFKHVQSLQHLCRFVILRLVRRDHMDRLPLPKPLRDYLNSMQYFSETLEESASPLTVVEHFV